MHVIILTGRSSREDLIAGLNAGADDYMVKPFEFEELRARVHVGVRVVALQERLAARVTELQAARDALARVASTDDLTGLNSRGRWFEAAALELERARRHRRPVGLLMADLDRFKQINDTYGHGVGDDVLCAFAEMLRVQCRRSDIVGRLGGEEFAVLLPETAVDVAHEVARRVVDSCRTLRVPSMGNAMFTASVGVTTVMATDDRIETALRRADQALYQAKRLGRNRSEIELGVAVDAPQRVEHS
jgi:two-component system chemotaxis response regulator CheY